MKTISIEEYHTDTPSLSLTNIDYIDSKEQYILVHDTLISLVVSWKVTISTSLSSLFHLFCVFLLVFAVWTLSCECSWDSLREISLALAFMLTKTYTRSVPLWGLNLDLSKHHVKILAL
jgi:hypothetical protein